MKEDSGFEEQSKEVKEQGESAKTDALYDIAATNEVMGLKAGRHFVWEMLADCGVYQDGFNDNPYVHARNSGMKRIGLRLLHKILSACPDKHEMMFAEHKYIEEENDG
ncbi:hypothetical protein CMI48_05095 [Candidatus Pacearchaeota archaeon]|jgi:hypothetical protein|nr:hypothetical protein [Candidatus Pacearchaeota archaeon]MAE50137.1 hypothetical protein [Candidatus Pacearchaeota archaeon]MAE50171.1 hypothetical protein [Candidatus Pacearchaeota archaeon]|tara:strand:- start:2215 stop:2538 length:324 start_codon:yes stop_codon:yes gene_type:complete